MAGYVMSGTAKEVVEAINGYLNTNSRSGELLKKFNVAKRASSKKL
jgi:hypothetical protein